MSAVAFEYPAEVREAVDGLEAFLRREVMPRHEKHGRLLGDERRRYSAEGIMADDLRELVDEVRLASAAAWAFWPISRRTNGSTRSAAHTTGWPTT